MASSEKKAVSKMVKRPARESWILGYLKKHAGESVDVLNRAFVDAYATATGAPVILMPFGADKCRQLGQDLSRLSAAGYLSRGRIGLTMAESGFPKWVWVYHLTESGAMKAEMGEAIAQDRAAQRAA
jgi:hypothetical protein